MSGMISPSIPIEAPQRLIIPIHSNAHFFVACFDCCCDVSIINPHFFKNIDVYDSLANKETDASRSHVLATLGTKVNLLFMMIRFAQHDESESLLQRVKYKNCPDQENSHDCGVFVIACVLHLLERLSAKLGTYSHGQMSQK